MCGWPAAGGRVCVYLAVDAFVLVLGGHLDVVRCGLALAAVEAGIQNQTLRVVTLSTQTCAMAINVSVSA